MAVLRAAAWILQHEKDVPAAEEIAWAVAGRADGREVFAGVAERSIARIVSNIAREGWLIADGKKPLRYTLTDKARQALAGEMAVAS